VKERLSRPISLIAFTGYGQERDQRRAYEAGFDRHLTKPVEAHVLRDALAVLTAKRRALDAREA
jgi:CheY-like chemotaxis protein